MAIRTWLSAVVLLASGSTALPAVERGALVLARVDGETVTGQEVLDEFVRRHGGHTKFLGGPTEARAFLSVVIDRRLLLQEAYRLELDKLPAVRAAIDAYTERKAVERLRAVEIDEPSVPTEAEILAAWQESTTTLYTVQQIVVPTLEAAEEVLNELEAGADFESLAREKSVARSRSQGGALAEIGWGAMSPEWEAVVFALAPKGRSRPFETEEGWQIVELRGIRQVEKPDFGKARDRISQVLRDRRRAELEQQFRDQLWSRHHALLAPLELTPEAIVAAATATPAAPLASWSGGELTFADAARLIDLEAMAGLPKERSEYELTGLIESTMQRALEPLEARARGAANWPEVATEVRKQSENLLERVLYADYILRDLKLEPAEIRASYDERRSEYTAPERRRLAHIVVGSESEATELRRRFLAGEEFAELARTASLDPETRNKGGDLGWVKSNDLAAEFSALTKVDAGVLSEPIATSAGWHLVLVKEIEPQHARPFEEVEREVAAKLLERRKSERRDGWLAQLREAASIEIDDAAVEALARQSGA